MSGQLIDYPDVFSHYRRCDEKAVSAGDPIIDYSAGDTSLKDPRHQDVGVENEFHRPARDFAIAFLTEGRLMPAR